MTLAAEAALVLLLSVRITFETTLRALDYCDEALFFIFNLFFGGERVLNYWNRLWLE